MSPTVKSAAIVKSTSRYILIVDDDTELGKTMAETLEPVTQCKIVVARKVNEALIKLNNQRFDLILLDLHFEHGSGESVLDHIRKAPSEQNFHTPVLVISGTINPPVLKRILPAISGVLVKPFEKAALVDRVGGLLTSGKK